MYFYLRTTTGLSLLDIFRRHRNSQLRADVASNPNATPEMLLELATDADEMVRQAVARNPSCSMECINLLLVDPVPRVPLHLAGNPNLPVSVMREWAGRGRTVPLSLASNIKCPEDVMLQLAEHEDYELRLNLAGNAGASARVLEVLAAAEEEGVRGQAACNNRLPLLALLRLLQDEDLDVRCAALGHWQCPPSFLVEASKSKSFDVLKCVARHPRTPPKILAWLADYEYSAEEFDPEWDEHGFPDTGYKEVPVALASNPMIPKEVLSRLEGHEDKGVSEAANKNPSREFDEDFGNEVIAVHWGRGQDMPFIHQPY